MLNSFNTLKALEDGINFYSLVELEKTLGVNICRLPVSIRIILESLIRNCDGKKVKKEDVERLCKWEPIETYQGDAPFVVSRVLLQDFTGVPLLVDLAAMREATRKLGENPELIEPLVPVHLVIDHSVQVDRSRTPDAFEFNLDLEFIRNQERYAFLKWGQNAFKTFEVFAPGLGICHQVNLEFLADVVTVKDNVAFFDTLVGTDSHTTMINGLGIVGWGVGGIEGEAAMLGQPLAVEMPQVIGLHLKGKLPQGVTATDLTLRITQLLRKINVVGKIVEFFGEGAKELSVADRAMIANMAPEYGATMGFFPVDQKTLDYLAMTGRKETHISFVKKYLQAQKVFGMPKEGELIYTKTIELDLSDIAPSVAGPKRPQDRIAVDQLKESFLSLLYLPIEKGGYGKNQELPPEKIYVHSTGEFSLKKEHEWGGLCEQIEGAARNEQEMVSNRPMMPPASHPGYSQEGDLILSHGSVVIAAITSCTNTSSPSVMLAAGLLAKKACSYGLKVNPLVKTSLAPGSRVVSDYLEKSGLQQHLDSLGFNVVAYGCTTCIGNSGPLDERLEKAIKDYDLVVASVLSGNRNFEARVHGSVKANFLMSPPLVIAYAIAGRVDIDLKKEPLGYSDQKEAVYLKDLWPDEKELAALIETYVKPELFKKRYFEKQDLPLWDQIATSTGIEYQFNKQSTYIQNPPYFEDFSLKLPKRKPLEAMRVLALLGDSVTTDHISPAGNFKKETPAGKYLLSLGVKEKEFNSYGSRRGNHEVMMRGTFANVRIKNKMAKGKEGGFTTYIPTGEIRTIYDAAMEYKKHQVPLIIFAGYDYGMGSSRDWAAKGSALLGVKAIVARSFERIHRSNLIGMGILPLQFMDDLSHESLGITGEETFSLKNVEGALVPRQEIILHQEHQGKQKEIKLLLRIDTPIEVEYYYHGGIMPYVLRHVLQPAS